MIAICYKCVPVFWCVPVFLRTGQVCLDSRSDIDKLFFFTSLDGAPRFGTFRPTNFSFAPFGPRVWWFFVPQVNKKGAKRLDGMKNKKTGIAKRRNQLDFAKSTF